jgi:hypothetical protein
MGKVYLPEQAAWKADLIGQLTRFPAGKYDDGVDTCSLIGRGIELMPAPRIRRAEPRREGGMLSETSGRNAGTAWMGV